MKNGSQKVHTFYVFIRFSLNFNWNYFLEYKFSCKSSAGLLLQTCGKKGFWGNLDYFRGNSLTHSTLCFIASVMGISGEIGRVLGVKSWHSYICNYANTWSIQFLYMFPECAFLTVMFWEFFSLYFITLLIMNIFQEILVHL